MPQVFVYIRNEDMDKWKTVEKKSLFIHDALNSDKPKPSEEKFVPRAPDPALGYPCCQKSKPCKHWNWDDVGSVWVNELTGATREV